MPKSFRQKIFIVVDACQVISSCIVSNVRSGHAPKKKGTRVVTSVMIFLVGTLTTFPWPLGRKSFCGLSRIDGNSGLKNGFVTKRLAIYAPNAAIRFSVAL